MDRQLSPRWQASASLGYATNGSLIPAATIVGLGHYNSWYAGVRFNRQMRPSANMFLSYEARLQALNTPTCTGLNCSTNFISHRKFLWVSILDCGRSCSDRRNEKSQKQMADD